MKKMINTERFTDSDWEKLASAMSESEGEKSGILEQFNAQDDLDTSMLWKNVSKTGDSTKIDVDNAWNKVSSGMRTRAERKEKPAGLFTTGRYMMKIAAAGLILISVGAASLYLFQKGLLSKEVIIATTDTQKNVEVKMADGSSIFLNRNTKLTYRRSFGRHGREVTLSGEAFFDIARDTVNPFTIDAGNATIEVLGTSFNVITNNPDSAVEVFVKTGQVLLTDNSGIQNIMIDPGYVGVMDLKASAKTLNTDTNYMAWITGQLKFDGQTLDVVLKSLKKVYNADIVADDQSILDEKWTSPPIDNESLDTIIRLICGSFNLNFVKDGNVYHLAK
jgi:transmembrane sensor